MSYVRLILGFTREKGLTTPLNYVVIFSSSAVQHFTGDLFIEG